MPKKLIVSFLIAAPVGAALGFAATHFLSPREAAGAFDIVLALIILGTLGAVWSLRSQRGRFVHKAAASSAI